MDDLTLRRLAALTRTVNPEGTPELFEPLLDAISRAAFLEPPLINQIGARRYFEECVTVVSYGRQRGHTTALKHLIHLVQQAPQHHVFAVVGERNQWARGRNVLNLSSNLAGRTLGEDSSPGTLIIDGQSVIKHAPTSRLEDFAMNLSMRMRGKNTLKILVWGQ